MSPSILLLVAMFDGTRYIEFSPFHWNCALIPQIAPDVRAGLTAAELDRLARIEAWDLSEVQARARARMRWSAAFAEDAVAEYRKFLGIVALSPTKRYGMSEVVDAVWHEHILSTRDYAACCGTVVDGFIHHEPEPADAPNVVELERLRAETVDELARVFTHVSPLWRVGDAQGIAKCCKHVTCAAPV